MEKSGFQKNFENILSLYKIFGPSHSRYVPPVSRAPASELVLQRGGLPSEIALPGGTSSPKLCIEARGRCALRNWDSDICPTHVPKKTTSVRNFDLISIQRSSN